MSSNGVRTQLFISSPVYYSGYINFYNLLIKRFDIYRSYISTPFLGTSRIPQILSKETCDKMIDFLVRVNDGSKLLLV